MFGAIFSTTCALFVVGTSLLAMETVAAGAALRQRTQNPLRITVFYESMCPASIQFITQILQPTCQKLCDHSITLDLVPYGSAETKTHGSPRTDFTFNCQHGPDECAGNKIHACAISKLPQRLALSFLNCTMSVHPDRPKLGGRLCAQSLSLGANQYRAIESCAAGFEGSHLLAGNGIRTQGVSPPLRWLPSVFFDENFENGPEKVVDGSNFFSAVCRYLALEGQKPEACLVA